MSNKREQIDKYSVSSSEKLKINDLENSSVVETFLRDRMKPFTKLNILDGESAGNILSKKNDELRPSISTFARQFSYENPIFIRNYIGHDRYDSYMHEIDNMDMAIYPNSDKDIEKNNQLNFDNKEENHDLQLLSQKKYLTQSEAASYLGKSPSYISGKIKDGTIPYCKKLKVIPREQLDIMIEQNLINQLSDEVKK